MFGLRSDTTNHFYNYRTIYNQVQIRQGESGYIDTELRKHDLPQILLFWLIIVFVTPTGESTENKGFRA